MVHCRVAKFTSKEEGAMMYGEAFGVFAMAFVAAVTWIY